MKVKIGRMMVTLPKVVFQRVLSMEAERFEKSFAFMTAEHHRVRNLAVSEMTLHPRLISPTYLSEKTSIPEGQVVSLLDDLEGNRSILYRDEKGNVLYAYPSTLEKTAQAVVFEKDKRVYAAGAFDALATPFVQGNLLRESMSATIQSYCHHCGEPIELFVDSDLNFKVLTEGAEPLISAPLKNEETTKDPHILDDVGRQANFFWSEEHARAYSDKWFILFFDLAEAAVFMKSSEEARFDFTY